ncbi:methionyl-tRNA formyltransferase, partial [Vibrio fluvialis]|nr:methionyl-tRNA formyltransferase [Vibrio fluvialis]
GLDTGDMLKIATLPIEASDTSGSMYDKLAELGPQALVECLSDIAQGTAVAVKQDDALANYAQKLSKEEAKIDWTLSAQAIERCVRAFNPWPMSHFAVADNQIKVWQARVEAGSSNQAAGTILKADKTGIYVATGAEILVLESLQIPGKKALPVQDILNARASWFEVGSQLN